MTATVGVKPSHTVCNIVMSLWMCGFAVPVITFPQKGCCQQGRGLFVQPTLAAEYSLLRDSHTRGIV